jgi:hypothetical protein
MKSARTFHLMKSAAEIAAIALKLATLTGGSIRCPALPHVARVELGQRVIDIAVQADEITLRVDPDRRTPLFINLRAGLTFRQIADFVRACLEGKIELLMIPGVLLDGYSHGRATHLNTARMWGKLAA